MSLRLVAFVLWAGILTGCADGPPDTADQAVAKDAWTLALPPVARVGAAYMIIENTGSQAIHLVGGDCAIAESVEIHTMEGGMRALEQLTIPAKGRVELKPGGIHLMLMGLKQVPQAGEQVQVMLHFADGRAVPVQVKTVKHAPGNGHADMHH